MYYQFSEVPGLAGKRRYVVIDEKDNVATVVENLRKAEVLEVGAKNITLLRDIPEGHKFTLSRISKGEYVVKYGGSCAAADMLASGAQILAYTTGAVTRSVHPSPPS